MKLIDYVRAARARLDQAGVSFGQGTTCAFDEAAWMVLWKLGLPLDDLDGVAQRPLSADEQRALDTLVEERIRGRRPTAYLTGEAWLQGVAFTVDERTIIPRSLIAEVLAEGLIDPWLPDPTRSVLDLCTGNGSLAVLAAMAWPEVTVDAADISADTLAVAALNVQRHGLQDRIRLHLGDGLQAVRGRGAAPRYDLVLCNPPYVSAAAMAALPPEFQAEPKVALDGGADGMDFIRILLAGILEVLSPNGVLVLEIGHERAHFDAAFPRLEAVVLPTRMEDDGVVLLTGEALGALAGGRP